MSNLIESYTPYINESTFNILINKAENAEFNKHGSNSKCAIIGNYVVLKTGNIPAKDKITDGVASNDSPYHRLVDSLYSLKQSGVNVVPILGYGTVQYGIPFSNGSRYDSGYIVQEKAKGQELLYPAELRGKSEDEKNDIIMQYINTLSNIPQEHYDKWVNDYKTITDSGIMIDPSKESNFFYDKDSGFSFIDLNFFAKENLFDKVDSDGQNHHAEFILYTMTPFRRFTYSDYYTHIKDEKDVEFAKKVILDNISKWEQALMLLGVTKEDIDFAMKQYTISFDCLNPNGVSGEMTND